MTRPAGVINREPMASDPCTPSVEWTAHPARSRPRDVALVASVVFLTMGAVLMVFQSYLADTERFAREVVPLLRELGVVADP